MYSKNSNKFNLDYDIINAMVRSLAKNAYIDLQFWNIANMLHARFSMRPSQSKFQYGWKPCILPKIAKNHASEIDNKIKIRILLSDSAIITGKMMMHV